MRATSPDSKVLVWTVGRDPGRVAEVLTAGAAGYLTKEDSPDELLAAIRNAASGSVSFSASVAGRLGEELARALARAGELEAELARVKDERHPGNVGQGRFPGEHLPRAADPGDGGQGHRVRAAQPIGPRPRARRVPVPAPGLARQADGHRRRDHHDRRTGARHVRAEPRRGRPGAVAAARRGREPAGLPAGRDRRHDRRTLWSRSPTARGSAAWCGNCWTTPAGTPHPGGPWSSSPGTSTRGWS